MCPIILFFNLITAPRTRCANSILSIQFAISDVILYLSLFKQNKYVFSYLSLLVQEGHFKIIEVFFLIVGHTHSSIDQYFSVLSRAIWRCHFLGSPVSLEALLTGESVEGSMSGKSWTTSEDHERKLKSKPLIVRKLSVVFQMKEALLQPLINTKLHYYSIPHVFRFEMYQGVCAMQYKNHCYHTDLNLLLVRRYKSVALLCYARIISSIYLYYE